ncbi:sensor histidine kinase [Anaeroselena agilis]|uniref:histidine kinase n=1 Tax=Anaeroselena agilis TaxID=3063788 RepID=A0ABU3P0H7_9FIRM|nr:HAMP domain-containing sensor histidine kinase [Selenomonadales bacterium 4137-cl]
MISIRTKLFLNISFLLVFFVLAAWCLSALFLEGFYTRNKKSALIDSALAIDALYRAGDKNIALELERIANQIGAGIIITDSDGYLKYSSFERLANRQVAAIPPRAGAMDKPPPPAITIIAREDIDGNSVLESQNDQGLNVRFMLLRRRLSGGDVLVIRLPLAAVTESAAYANRFMAFSGLLAILAGCTWAYFFARRFTVPLRDLSNVAASISRLDFSQWCHIDGDDEVGRLGKSVNNLSSQLSKAIAALNEKNRQLAADVEKERNLDKLRRSFVSNVSHELKTPISLILGYAEGLRENVVRDKADKEYYCAVIADEAEKMAKLVNGLLDLSQIESGYFRLERTDFDLSLLLDEIALKYRAILYEKDITLRIERPSSLMVNGDILRIEQVITNMLNNAITHAAGARLVKITAEAAGDRARVNVYNTGGHIPQESLGDLWQSFYKADKARTRELGGHGLGLSIVRAIQELHGNAYGVENVAGGVRFWFALYKAS